MAKFDKKAEIKTKSYLRNHLKTGFNINTDCFLHRVILHQLCFLEGIHSVILLEKFFM